MTDLNKLFNAKATQFSGPLWQISFVIIFLCFYPVMLHFVIVNGVYLLYYYLLFYSIKFLFIYFCIVYFFANAAHISYNMIELYPPPQKNILN